MLSYCRKIPPNKAGHRSRWIHPSCRVTMDGSWSVSWALSDTIDALHAAGYPPVFILMYDQAWLLCERLFPLMEALMGPEVALDTSIFAWSLRRATPLRTISTTRKVSSEAHSGKESTAKHAIGDNFGVPHRDSRYTRTAIL